MNELIKDVNLLLPMGGVIVAITVYFHQKLQGLNEKIHDLQISNMDKFATKDDIHKLEIGLDRIHDKLDKMVK
jgi:hypothetical protein